MRVDLEAEDVLPPESLLDLRGEPGCSARLKCVEVGKHAGDAAGGVEA